MKNRVTKTSFTRQERKQNKADLNLSDLITQKEAAEARGVTQAAIGDLIKRGRLRSVELFGRRLVYRSEIEGFEKEKPGPKSEL